MRPYRLNAIRVAALAALAALGTGAVAAEQGATLVSLDRRLVEAARALGVAAELL